MAAVMPEVLALLGVNVVVVLESVVNVVVVLESVVNAVVILESVVNAVVVVESVVNPVMILVRSVALPESPSLPEEDVLSDDVPKSQVLTNVLEDDPGACSVIRHIHK